MVAVVRITFPADRTFVVASLSTVSPSASVVQMFRLKFISAPAAKLRQNKQSSSPAVVTVLNSLRKMLLIPPATPTPFHHNPRDPHSESPYTVMLLLLPRLGAPLHDCGSAVQSLLTPLPNPSVVFP